jgi:hypothetical protein
MPRDQRTPFRCRCCGAMNTMALISSRIRTLYFKQTYAHEWKFVSGTGAFECPLFVSCPACGLASDAPASLIEAFHRGHGQFSRHRKNRAKGK